MRIIAEVFVFDMWTIAMSIMQRMTVCRIFEKIQLVFLGERAFDTLENKIA